MTVARWVEKSLQTIPPAVLNIVSSDQATALWLKDGADFVLETADRSVGKQFPYF